MTLNADGVLKYHTHEQAKKKRYSLNPKKARSVCFDFVSVEKKQFMIVHRLAPKRAGWYCRLIDFLRFEYARFFLSRPPER
jgi:hypothetical protein